MATSTDTLTLANIKARLQSDTPPIFKSLRRILMTVGAIGTAVILATATLPVSLPAIVTTIASYAIVAGAVGSGMATLTSTTPAPLENQSNNIPLTQTKTP